MAVVNPGSYGTSSPHSQGPETLGELVGGFLVLGIFLAGAGIGLYSLFHLGLLATACGTLAAALPAAPWPGVGELAASLGLGVAAGFAIALGRHLLRGEDRLMEELAGAVLAPDTLTAARLRWTAAGLSVGAGVMAGLAVAWLGIVGAEAAAPGASVAAPLLRAAGWIGGGGGGAGGPGGDGLVELVALVLGAALLAALGTMGLFALAATLAQAGAGGAAGGVGKELGLALGLVLTRAERTALTPEAAHDRPGVLEPLAAMEAVLAESRLEAGPEEARAAFDRFRAWLAALAGRPGPGHGEAAVDEYWVQGALHGEWQRLEREHADLAREPGQPGWERQKPQRVERAKAREAAKRERAALVELVRRAEELRRRRDPARRLASTDGAPPLDGTPGAVYAPGALREALRRGLVEGALAGGLGGLFALLAARLGGGA